MSNVQAIQQIILPPGVTALALPAATTLGGTQIANPTMTPVSSLTFGSVTLNGSSNSATASLVSGAIPATLGTESTGVLTLSAQIQITPTAVGTYSIPITLPTKTSNLASASDLRVRAAYGRDANGVQIANLNPVPVTGTSGSPSTTVNIQFTSQSTAVHTIDLALQYVK